MSARDLILLSPHRLPTQSISYLADDDVAAFLHGIGALWHPAALSGASGPPRMASPYDHEQPQAGHLYAVPVTPTPMLPEDWDERVRAAGARAFRATPDRQETLANLLNVLREPWPDGPDVGPFPGQLADHPDRVAPFRALGFGLLIHEALCEAMSHDNLLSAADFWLDIGQAIEALRGQEPDTFRSHLEVAARRLLAAREVLYSATLYLVDLFLPDFERPGLPWPNACSRGSPLNVVLSSAGLQQLAQQQPAQLAQLREWIAQDVVEICGGGLLEREDALLPAESQLWNLQRGLSVGQELLGREVRVYGRRRFGYHPQLPLFLQSVGLGQTLLQAFDESVIPSFHSPMVNWPARDGKQAATFTRLPLPAESPQTFFHLAHHLHRTIVHDHAATLSLLHRAGKPAALWYEDWLELGRLAPVLGRWMTLNSYFAEVVSGDYMAPPEADEFHGDHLTERTASQSPTATRQHPVSFFAEQARGRRRLDTAWTLTGLARGLGVRPGVDEEPFEARLTRLEDRFESEGATAEEMTKLQDEAAGVLARRLLVRAGTTPGYLLLNPCSFKRRVIVDLPGLKHLLPLTDLVKACQIDGGSGRAVVEIPALGFAWLPREGVPGTAAPSARMKLADRKGVRNEFLDAEIDPATGGLRSLRDARTRVGRMGQRLTFNPGCKVVCSEVRVTSTGPALGEVVTEGKILDPQDQVLATFRQRFQAWVGRPMLDLRLEINPVKGPEGYPWHAYYGCRFAWADDRLPLLRGCNGVGYLTANTRPESPDYLELRSGQGQNVVIFPGGLPFHQRQGARMVDVILLPEGETCRTFDLGLSLDRPSPLQTAQGLVTPVPMVAVEQGPPPGGASGWLFHCDNPNLLLTTLRPAADGVDAVVARFLEIGGQGGQAGLRCARDPKRAVLLDARGSGLHDLPIKGDTVELDVMRNDLLQVRVDFS